MLEQVQGREYLSRITRLALGGTFNCSWQYPISLAVLEGTVCA